MLQFLALVSSRDRICKAGDPRGLAKHIAFNLMPWTTLSRDVNRGTIPRGSCAYITLSVFRLVFWGSSGLSPTEDSGISGLSNIRSGFLNKLRVDFSIGFPAQGSGLAFSNMECSMQVLALRGSEFGSLACGAFVQSVCVDGKTLWSQDRP